MRSALGELQQLPRERVVRRRDRPRAVRHRAQLARARARRVQQEADVLLGPLGTGGCGVAAPRTAWKSWLAGELRCRRRSPRAGSGVSVRTASSTASCWSSTIAITAPAWSDVLLDVIGRRSSETGTATAPAWITPRIAVAASSVSRIRIEHALAARKLHPAQRGRQRARPCRRARSYVHARSPSRSAVRGPAPARQRAVEQPRRQVPDLRHTRKL